MKESLSALLDGECSPAELDRVLAELERDPDLREHFSRQCLARDSRMGTRIRKAQLDFPSRVLAALHSEQDAGSVVMPFGNGVRRLPWRAAVSLAAAATVGAAAVLALRPGTPETSPASQTAAMSQAGVMPVPARPMETRFAELDDENARQLRNYLMAYSQSRGQQGVGSALGYARYAAYTGDRPVEQPPDRKP